MKIENGENFIELEVQLETDTALPSYGDALIGIVVSSNGYIGKNQVWVAKEELELFSASLRELEKHRKGEAVLNSMSPDELNLRIYAYDGVGHLAIEGTTGHQVAGSVSFNHSIQFGFIVEAEQIVRMASSAWSHRF
ncbi:WapI family immunity protein [Grimontia marina]|uniref:Uncharacterized protein n=1 Tax=Grimontia marina TaxID=646534 RepID=A0A128F7J6_9GAMM|nr:hypothetical protein [Grimontia marina]CZF82773.1 hypothetical protein GMA8713_02362 [Grimontia marina]